MGLAFLLERGRRRLGDPRNPGGARTVYSYLDRGHYEKQLRNLRRYFPDRQLLVLDNGQLSEHHAATVARVLRFLGVSPATITEPRQIFSGDYDRNAGSEYKPLLRYYFRGSNSRLRQLLIEMGATSSWRWLGR